MEGHRVARVEDLLLASPYYVGFYEVVCTAIVGLVGT